jgi:hypothetical protein
MREARDSFLKFLADNLVGIPLHPIRVEPNDPSSSALQVNALNVQFLDLSMGVHMSTQQVVLDILHDSENTAVEWAADVWDLLSAAFYTPQLDYSNPSSPVSVGNNVMWEPNFRFRSVINGYYFHYSALLNLRFTPA